MRRARLPIRARPLRLPFAGGVYHVTARGNERKAIVRDEADRARFVGTLAAIVEQDGVVCHAWVLMDNHSHLLRERPLLEHCRSVVLNPVRAGVVKHPAAYPWSSYRATAGLRPAPDWLTGAWVLEQFGRRRGAAQVRDRDFVAEGMRRPSAPWQQVVGQIYLGDEAFIRPAPRASRRGADPEIPRQQRQPAWCSPEAVLAQVTQRYGLAVADVVRPTRRPSEARQAVLYGVRRWAGEGPRAIARRMGISDSAVSRRVAAVAQRLAQDQRFCQRVVALSDVKVKT